MAENTPQQEQQVVVDDVSYNLSDLTEAAKAQLGNVRVCEQKLVQLQQEAGMIRTARAAYVEALKAGLKDTTGTPVEKAADSGAVETIQADDTAAES